MSAPNPDREMIDWLQAARQAVNLTSMPVQDPTREQRMAAIAAAATLIQMEILSDARFGNAELLAHLLTATDHTGIRLPDALLSALTVLRRLHDPSAPERYHA